MCILCESDKNNKNDLIKLQNDRSLYCSCKPLVQISLQLTHYLTKNKLRVLDFTGSVSLISIPKIIGLESLNCNGCTSLTQVPSINSLWRINLNGCISLTEIPILSKLEHLNCSQCPGLKVLQGFDKLRTLDCSECTGLTRICDLNNLENLNCSKCSRLFVISDTKKLQVLNCSHCPRLKNIDGTKTNILRGLYCSECPRLTKIELCADKLIMINCMGSRSLIQIPHNNRLTFQLVIKGCPWINISANNSYHSNIKKLTRIQHWVKNMLALKRLKIFTPMIIQAYYDPQCKGGYFHKKEIQEFVDNNVMLTN